MHVDAKWLLIRHCIQSKNPREDQCCINYSFGVGLSVYLVDQKIISGIASHYITHAGDIQKPALTYLVLQSWIKKNLL